MQENYNVGIYCRLSRDDERTGMSVSIENQNLLQLCWVCGALKSILLYVRLTNEWLVRDTNKKSRAGNTEIPQDGKRQNFMRDRGN